MLSVLVLIFQYKPVQTWAAKKATAYLSKKLDTKVDIKSLYIKPFTSVVLEDLYVLDKQNDTLLRTPKLTVELNGFSLFSSIQKRLLDFKLIQLDNGSFYLKNLPGNKTNFKFILDSFASKDTTKGKPWTMLFGKVKVNNFHFRYKNTLVKAAVKGINFDDLDVRNFSTEVTNMDIKNHIFRGDVKDLTLSEKSGFKIENFTANATVDTNQILVEKMFLKTPNSLIRDHLRMRFKTFDDMKDFETKVRVDADLKTAHLSSKDISYFTSGLDKISFELGLDGRVQGLVNNLKAKKLTVTAGQATFIRGNFNIKGLPVWEETFMELDFEQIATNKKDIDRLLRSFTGNSKAMAPAIVEKFGNVNFTGRFTGLQNDFVAYGTFKTGLGRFDTDINLKINKQGVPSYSGKVDALNFDLGTLLDERTLGRTTFAATIKGSGNDVKTLNTKVDAKIKYISFKGYSYNNVALNGTFAHEKINGLLTINDRNIKLNAKGIIDIAPKLPVYDFSATITDANLNRLKLLKDTITISTIMQAKFSGNDLKNIKGHVLLSPMRIVDPRNNYLLDSAYVAATGTGTDRSIVFRSDALDGSIRGSFDLATLPSYFKTIVKKYIPSIKLAITPPKPQNFQFNLAIKNLDPLTAIFMPDLKVPDQGTFTGTFNSNTQQASLNGYVKTIKYGDIVFHDLILDENTSAENLGLNVSLTRVDLSKNLYIKNVDISNFLNRDSLKFNIKLADKDATNQLDLYGLVAFGRDTTAKLELLPSDVILENQKWRIQEEVQIRLLDGKTKVEGFQLSNGDQKVKIDGFISSSPQEELKVVFEKFNMSTINQLTKASDITMGGLLNGDVKLASILKSPGIDAHLKIDTMRMNNTLVGDVTIVSNLDNEAQKANVDINIQTRGLETLKVNGTYYIVKDADDRLGFDVKMDQTQVIILEPFIKSLVSDIKGTISTNLKLTGTPQKPELNGEVRFNNTGLTVNYLKAAFILDDKVTVKNSVISLDDLQLKDPHGGKGTAKGVVDLNNLSNPTINVVLTAQNLQALNTAFKDNHVYFGTAYATGTFKFNGPVDNMNIDINASTEAGTVFNLPLNTSSTVSEYDFIKFVSHKDTTGAAENKVKAFNGVTLNMVLNVDEKSIVRITTDYGVLQGSGIARNLQLKINSLGDFDMYGDFQITSGKFEFTAKNFISKNFTVNQGGTIRWTGSPGNAEINLKAVYEVRTDIAPLYTAAGLQSPRGSQQVLVQAELIITKSLIQPVIEFDFNFPTEPSIKDDVGTYLADNNNRNQQALSIIVRRAFAPGNNNNLTNQVLGTAGSAVSEFAFNQLNSFISQSNIKGFDLNIRSFNEASASLKFLNDRLVFNGSLFNNNAAGNGTNLFNNSGSLLNSDFSKLTKDFEASYRIRQFQDGSLTGRYSYRVLNTTTLNTIDQLTAQYVNGLGLVYQRDFDNVREFLRNIFRRPNRRQRPVDPTVPTNTPGAVPRTTPDSAGAGPKNPDDEE